MAGPLLSTIRDLQRRKGRERRGLALAEGVRLVEEALAAGLVFRGAITSPSLEATARGAALKDALVGRGVPLEQLDDRTLHQLADTDHPQGVLAVLVPRHWALDDIRADRGAAVLALDGVQDPGNVGAICRTAWGLGAAGVIALPGTADLLNPKALRGSMGATFRLPCVTAGDEAFQGWLRDRQATLWVAAVDGTPVRELTATNRRVTVLLLGNEGAGVRPELAGSAEGRVSIPLTPGAESLNVAVAAGILLHEVLRDR